MQISLDNRLGAAIREPVQGPPSGYSPARHHEFEAIQWLKQTSLGLCRNTSRHYSYIWKIQMCFARYVHTSTTHVQILQHS